METETDLEQTHGVIDQINDAFLADVRASRSCAAEFFFGWKQQPVHAVMQAVAKKHRKFSIDVAVEHGKTSQFSILDPLISICERNAETGCMMSLTGETPQACLKVIAHHLEYNERLHLVYPQAQIDSYNQDGLRLVRPHGSTIKDPHLRAMGIMSSIYGKRWTTWWSDDILDLKSTWTPESRKKIWQIIKSECLSRIAQYNSRTDVGGRHRDTGTPFHVEDARHMLQRIPEYGAYRFDGFTGEIFNLKNGQVVKKFEGGLWPELVEVDGRLWGWPRERLEEKRIEWGETEFNRAVRCIPLSGTLEIFRSEYIELCKIAGRDWWRFYHTQSLLDGRLRVCWRQPLNRNDVIVTGVDLAVSKKSTGDRTVFHTDEILPGGTKVPLEIRAGNIEAPEIAQQMIAVLDRYPNHRGFRVENNAAQDYILQIARDVDMMRSKGATDEHLSRLQVIAHTTTSRNKFDALTGIRGMGIEFEQNRWVIPCDATLRVHGLFQEWIDEMLGFDPTSHTGDILMASWLASEEARRYAPNAKYVVEGEERQSEDTWTAYGVFS